MYLIGSPSLLTPSASILYVPFRSGAINDIVANPVLDSVLTTGFQ